MQELEQRIAKLELEIKFLRSNARKTRTWVKVSEVVRLTGWDKEEMRRARENGYIEFRTKNGFEYLVESIHPMFIK
jgi:hypothetical protein